MRLGEFGELSGWREAVYRRRQDGVGIGVAIGCAIQLRQRQRGAQFEAARLLRLRDGDRGLQSLLGRGGIGRIALQQDLGADAVYLRFVPALLGALQLGERIVQAPEPGIRLAGIRFGFSGVRRWSRKKITRWVSSACRISAIVASGSFRARSTPLTSAPSAPTIGATEMVS